MARRMLSLSRQPVVAAVALLFLTSSVLGDNTTVANTTVSSTTVTLEDLLADTRIPDEFNPMYVACVAPPPNGTTNITESGNRRSLYTPDKFSPSAVEKKTAAKKSKVYERLAFSDTAKDTHSQLRDIPLGPHGDTLCDHLPVNPADGQNWCESRVGMEQCAGGRIGVVCMYTSCSYDMWGEKIQCTGEKDYSSYTLISEECSHQILHAFHNAGTMMSNFEPPSKYWWANQYPGFITAGHCFWDWCLAKYNALNSNVASACNNPHDNAIKQMCTVTSALETWNPMVWGCEDPAPPTPTSLEE